MNMKIVLLVLVLVVLPACVCAADSSVSDIYGISDVSFDVVNVSDGEPFKDKATELAGGDCVICFGEYRDNVQYSKGVHIDHWYVGGGEEDIYPHHTMILKEIVFYRDLDGNVINRTQSFDKGFEAFPLIDGYTPFKAQVFFKEF